MNSKKTFFRNLLVALAALALIVYFYPGSEKVHYKYEEGKPWNYAQLTARYEMPIRQDSAKVRERIDSLEAAFIPFFTVDKSVTARYVESRINSALAGAADTMSHEDKKIKELVTRFLRRDIYREDMDGKPQRYVISDEYADYTEGGDTVLRVMDRGKVNRAVVKTRADVRTVSGVMNAIENGVEHPEISQWLKRYRIEKLIKPNLRYDSITEVIFQGEVQEIKKDQGRFVPGQTIIEKGRLISHQDFINIQTYEEYANNMGFGGQSKLLIFLGHLLYASMLLGSLFMYLWLGCPAIWVRFRSVLFVFILITVFFLLGVACEAFINSGMYLVPYVVVPILLAVFFDNQAAMFVNIVLALLCASCVPFSLEFIALQFCGAVAAVYSLRELSRRSQLMRTALFVLGTYLVTYIAIELLMNGSVSDISLRMMCVLAVSALLCSVAYILMAAVEKLFGFVSVVTLVELCDINNPLLRKLSSQCPGTFQHSMAVGNLASDAAVKIGANDQLVRAGAFYHDIGKMGNPNFFTENQRGVNPHDALTPDKSASIIIQHVTDGLNIADKAGLPSVIKNFIREHHGAGKAKFFYYTHCKAHPDEEVDPAPFTYPGPNPRSRETSLLMMADAVEAASRSLKEHTPESIANLVDKIIDTQIAEGLHNDSSLSFRDVKLIKQEFVKRLMTMYHSRISYPDDPNNKKTPDTSND